MAREGSKHRTVDVMEDELVDVLVRETGLKPAIAREFVRPIVAHLADAYGGARFYVPVVRRQYPLDEIRKTLDAAGCAAVCERFSISRASMYRLLGTTSARSSRRRSRSAAADDLSLARENSSGRTIDALQDEFVGVMVRDTGLKPAIAREFVRPMIQHLVDTYAGERLYIPTPRRNYPVAEIRGALKSTGDREAVCKRFGISSRTLYRVLSQPA